MRTLPLILGRPSAECAPLLARLQALCQPLVPSVRPPEELQRIHLPGPDTVVLLLGLDAAEIVRCLGRLGSSGGPRRILVHCDQRERTVLAAAARAGASLFSLAELIALESSILAPSDASGGVPADASIHRLLRDYNHFLRNRLSTLEQIVALLADQLERDPSARTWVRRLEREMKRIESTTERLLELSSPLPTEVEAIDPLEVFQHVAETTRRRSSAPIEFRFEPAERPLPRVRGQRELAAAVATEVLQNAAAHALRSSAPAVVRTLFTPVEGGVEVRVLHSGEGIPAADAERALAPFFTTEDQGSGLGLTIARRFLDHMGGAIALEAHEERGHFPVLRFARADG
ncbi:MAG: HAMP domain-containing histidine kinase [Planctomycetes bacterium]|nr:HAMP domain-containing histidine kinase [Planctomycetota bacterium]